MDVAFSTVAQQVSAVAAGLCSRGVRPGDRVAIVAETQPGCTVADLAALAVGAVVVPVYPTSTQDAVGWVVRDSGARLAVVGSAAHARTVRAAAPDCEVVALSADAHAPTLDELAAPVVVPGHEGRGAVPFAAVKAPLRRSGAPAQGSG